MSLETTRTNEINNPVDLKPNPEVLNTIDELISLHNTSGCRVVYVRSSDKYNVNATKGNNRTGHVPGAMNLKWNQLLENSRNLEGVRKFKSAKEIKSLFDQAGVDGSKNKSPLPASSKVYFYCVCP